MWASRKEYDVVGRGGGDGIKKVFLSPFFFIPRGDFGKGYLCALNCRRDPSRGQGLPPTFAGQLGRRIAACARSQIWGRSCSLKPRREREAIR